MTMTNRLLFISPGWTVIWMKYYPRLIYPGNPVYLRQLVHWKRSFLRNEISPSAHTMVTEHADIFFTWFDLPVWKYQSSKKNISTFRWPLDHLRFIWIGLVPVKSLGEIWMLIPKDIVSRLKHYTSRVPNCGVRLKLEGKMCTKSSGWNTDSFVHPAVQTLN